MQHTVGNESKTADLKKIILDIKQPTKKNGAVHSCFDIAHLESSVVTCPSFESGSVKRRSSGSQRPVCVCHGW